MKSEFATPRKNARTQVEITGPIKVIDIFILKRIERSKNKTICSVINVTLWQIWSSLNGNAYCGSVHKGSINLLLSKAGLLKHVSTLHFCSWTNVRCGLIHVWWERDLASSLAREACRFHSRCWEFAMRQLVKHYPAENSRAMLDQCFLHLTWQAVPLWSNLPNTICSNGQTTAKATWSTDYSTGKLPAMCRRTVWLSRIWNKNWRLRTL